MSGHDNFLSDIWQNVTQKQIPSLFALSCATVYLALPTNNTAAAAHCACPKSSTRYYQSECTKTCSLWELIKGGMKQKSVEECKHFEFNVQGVEVKNMQKLGLPKAIVSYMMLTKDSYYYGSHSTNITNLAPGKIRWVNPESILSGMIRDGKFIEYYHGEIMEDELFHCIEGLDSLDCECMRNHAESASFMVWIEQIKRERSYR